MAQVSDKTLAWLWSVLQNVPSALLEAAGAMDSLLTQHIGLRRSPANILLRRAHHLLLPIALPANRSLHPRERHLCPPPHALRHTPGSLSRHNVPFSSQSMDTAIIPARSSNHVRNTWLRHGHSTWSARRRGWEGVSPVFERLDKDVGSGERGRDVGVSGAGI